MSEFEVDRNSHSYMLGVAEYERDKYKSELASERERCARLVEQMIGQKPDNIFGKPAVRMALAIAARAIRRGRHLTEYEKLENLAKGFEEDDPDFAKRFRKKVGINGAVGNAGQSSTVHRETEA